MMTQNKPLEPIVIPVVFLFAGLRPCGVAVFPPFTQPLTLFQSVDTPETIYDQ